MNHFEAGSNCQVFNGNITACTFAMPGSTVTQQAPPQTLAAGTDGEPSGTAAGQPSSSAAAVQQASVQLVERAEALFSFIHPSVGSDEEWLIHDEVKRLVVRQGIQEICRYLKALADNRRILLPQSPSVAYAELVRMGMPNSSGFCEKTFQKYYRRG